MELNQYQQQATKSASYPHLGNNIIYPALGLIGEAGEVAEKVKKIWRNENITDGNFISPESRNEIIKELGDVLWYIAAMCIELNVKMDEIAQLNLDKLADRLKRNVIKSSGDNR